MDEHDHEDDAGYVSSLSENEQNQSTRERVGTMRDEDVAAALHVFYSEKVRVLIGVPILCKYVRAQVADTIEKYLPSCFAQNSTRMISVSAAAAPSSCTTVNRNQPSNEAARRKFGGEITIRFARYEKKNYHTLCRVCRIRTLAAWWKL